MKPKIISLLLLIMGLSQSVLVEAQRSIRIVDSNLVRVERENGEFSLVFEIECAFKGILDSQLAFFIAPLDEDEAVIVDSSGEPLLSGEFYQMTEDNGQGVVEVCVPLSYFPQNTDNHYYVCMIFDAETEDTMADSGPLSFSTQQIKNLMTQKAMNQALDFFDLFLGGGGGSSKDGIFGGTKEKEKKKCPSCSGSGKCFTCMGYGVYYEKTCWDCGGSGKCNNCHGEGYY